MACVSHSDVGARGYDFSRVKENKKKPASESQRKKIEAQD